MKGGYNLGICDILSTVADILTRRFSLVRENGYLLDGGVEEIRLLGDDSDVVPEEFDVELVDGIVIDGNLNG